MPIENLKQLIDEQSTNELASFLDTHPELDLNHLSPTGCSALWWALTPPQNKEVSFSVVNLLCESRRINPTQCNYNLRPSQLDCTRPITARIMECEHNYVAPAVLHAPLAAIAADSQNTHNPLIVTTYDNYCAALYRRYGGALEWQTDFDQFAKTQGYMTNPSFQAALTSLKTTQTTRELHSGSNYGLTNAQLVMLVWRALKDTHPEHYVEGADWSDAEITARKRKLLDNIVRAQNEYGPNHPACFMGTRHHILSTLDKVHKDCFQEIHPLSKEGIMEDYEECCALQLQKLAQTHPALYGHYLRSLFMPTLNTELDTQLEQWIAKVKTDFWENIARRQKETPPAYQLPKQVWEDLKKDVHSYELSPKKHTPSLLASQLASNYSWLKYGHAANQKVEPEIHDLGSFDAIHQWVQQHYTQNKSAIQTYLKDLVNEKTPLCSLFLNHLPSEHVSEQCMALWEAILHDCWRSSDFDELLLRSVLTQLETYYQTHLGDLTPWLKALPSHIKIDYFTLLLTMPDFNHASASQQALEFALRKGHLAHFPLKQEIHIEDRDLRGVDLSTIDLTYVSFTHCDLRLTNVFVNPTLKATHLVSATIEEDILLLATKLNHTALTAYLDAKPAHITKLTSAKHGAKKNSGLHIALLHGKTETARAILERCPAKPELIYAENVYGHTPLDIAAARGNTETVKAILKRLPNHLELISTTNKRRDTGFHSAAQEGHTKVVMAILEAYRPLIKSKNEREETALHCAVEFGQTETVKAILKAYPNNPELMKEKTTRGETALHRAVNQFWEPAMTQAILEAYPGTDLIFEKDIDDTTVLQTALKKYSAEIVCSFLPAYSSLVDEVEWSRLRTLIDSPYIKHECEYVPHLNLFYTAAQMENHAKKLGSPYNEPIPPLLTKLKKLTVDFASTTSDKVQIKLEFTETYQELLLHTKKHRQLWKPLLINLAIAATGIGILALAIHYLINQKLGFFTQTRREHFAEEIKKTAVSLTMI